MDEKVILLQKNLALIRTCAGWSAAELGEKLDVSRQMVSNLETGRNKMTQMQYLAIRQVLAEEIEKSASKDDTQMLKDVIRVLVDEPKRFSEEQRTLVLADANLLAPSIVSKKTTRKKAASTWAVLAGVVVAAVVAVTGSVLLTDKD